jgi:pantothenate kinase
MSQPIDLDGLIAHLAPLQSARLILGMAGAPGSGKSTLATRLEQRLNAIAPDSAAVLPMDGYHYDDILLNQLGRRARKGAPDTFDVGGFRHTLMRLRRNDEDAVAVPIFDRDIEIARAGARLIPRAVRIIIVEGNYLLLRQQPWAELKPLFHMTVMIETDTDTLRQRLTARWQGYQLPPEEIRRKVEDNDLPNGRFVATESAPADFRLVN